MSTTTCTNTEYDGSDATVCTSLSNCVAPTAAGKCVCAANYEADNTGACVAKATADTMACTGSTEEACTKDKTDYCVFNDSATPKCSCKDTSVTNTSACPKVSSASPLAIAMIVMMVCAILSAVIATVVIAKKKAVQRNNAQLIVSDVM